MKISAFQLKEFEGTTVENTPKPPKLFERGGTFRGEPPPPPPPPSFSEEQLKTAERDAYKKGFLEGTEEGRKQVENEQAAVDAAIMKSLSNVMSSVQPLLLDYQATITQFKCDMPKVALAIAKKVAGRALTDNAAAAVEDIALRCVETMVGEPKLTITAHSSLAKGLAQKLEQVVEKLQSPTIIHVLPDDDIAPEECKVEWGHGQFARHTGQLWQEIDKVVENMIASATYQNQLHMDTLFSAVTSPPTNEKE